jgi:dephospho-CoA kinase
VSSDFPDAEPSPPASSPSPIRVLGLLGGIGAGKSTVAKRLAALGAVVIDADRLGHETLRRPEVVAGIAERFGPVVLDADGNVNRAEVARIVFADEAARADLEGIVHPIMEREMTRRIAERTADPAVPLVVLDAAILLEKNWSRFCEALLHVDSPRTDRIRRLRSSRGWSDEDLRRREAAQLAPEEKARRADFRIRNDGSVADLERRVDEWYQQRVRPAGSPRVLS